MSEHRWIPALVVALVAACGAPATAIAPSGAPSANGAGLVVRPITQIAALLAEPLDLRGLAASGFALVRSDGGEQRIRQVLSGGDGRERLRVETTLDGALRLVARSGVALGDAELSSSSAIARALRHLLLLGLEIPAGAPAVDVVAGRSVVSWTRRVRGIEVPNDGVRVVVNGVGALVGIAVEESPLAAPPTRIARLEAVRRAAAALLPSGAEFVDEPRLAWLPPPGAIGDASGARPPRMLIWSVEGVTAAGSSFLLLLDAGSLALLGGDAAP